MTPNEREKHYDELFGPVDNPMDMVNYYVHMGRQTGKTYKMIMSIPNEPIFIMVHKNSYSKEIIRMVKELRPDYNTDNIRFVTPLSTDRLLGFNRPIYVDNCVLDMVQIDYVKQLNKYYGPKK